MLSANDIANLALSRLGVTLTLSDVQTENSVQAKIIRKHLQIALDTIAASHKWNFLTRFQSLILEVEEPNPMYKYAYKFPSDCLVIRQVAPMGQFPTRDIYHNQVLNFTEQYWPSGKVVLTNVMEAHAEYTSRVSIADVVPEHFGRAAAAQLSIDIGPQLITNNYNRISNTLNSTARADINAAIANDLAREPEMQKTDSTFVRARQGYYGGY